MVWSGLQGGQINPTDMNKKYKLLEAMKAYT